MTIITKIRTPLRSQTVFVLNHLTIQEVLISDEKTRWRQRVECVKTGGNVCRDSLVTHYLLWCPAVVHSLLRRGTLVVCWWEGAFLL